MKFYKTFAWWSAQTYTPPSPPPPHTLGTRGFFFVAIKFPIVLRSRKTYHFKVRKVIRLTRLLTSHCSFQRCPRILLTKFYQQLKKKTVESSVTCRTIRRIVKEETHPRIIRVSQSGWQNGAKQTVSSSEQLTDSTSISENGMGCDKPKLLPATLKSWCVFQEGSKPACSAAS